MAGMGNSFVFDLLEKTTNSICNLVQMIFARSSYKDSSCHLNLAKMAAMDNSWFWLTAIVKKNSTLKLQMFCNSIQFMLVRSSTNIRHFIMIGQKPWSPRKILVSDWLKLKKKIFSETRRHNELLIWRNEVWVILYKIFIFHANHTTNMAVIGSSCLWLANYKKYSPKPFGQINWNLEGCTYGRFCIKFPQMIGEQHSFSPLGL